MPKVKKIDHIAILTGDMDGALNFWRDALELLA
ncbi:MAG: VOC family protein [Anaerolineales bacterium]|nr:VOC family protein [Anaerolineales bacterium]